MSDWKPIGPEHKKGRWIIAINVLDPDNRAIVWWDDNADTRPWVGSAGDHDYPADAFTHAIPFPEPPSLI